MSTTTQYHSKMNVEKYKSNEVIRSRPKSPEKIFHFTNCNVRGRFTLLSKVTDLNFTGGAKPLMSIRAVVITLYNKNMDAYKMYIFYKL